VSEELVERALRGEESAFAEIADRHRAELQLHCYRILGSTQDAEDTVQETLLAAWRSLVAFEARASIRTWLYRIATNRCLNALRDRGRRPQEPAPPPAGTPEPPPPTRFRDPEWLEPYPDALLEEHPDQTPGPEARYETRETIGLAFIAALQHLPPYQRAVLVLRDVHGYRAREVAEMLDVTEISVNRSLQRARRTLDGAIAPDRRDSAPAPASPAERDLVARFTTAFEAGDVSSVLALLHDDALLTMPPAPLEYEGPAAIGRFLSTVPAGGALDQFRLIPTRANGQPAFGCYLRDPHAPIAHAYGLMVLTLAGDRISAITGFPDTSVFRAFGLPRTIPAD
jgi:RNA polymerase sigma-70 factor (TIGR02960 family)